MTKMTEFEIKILERCFQEAILSDAKSNFEVVTRFLDIIETRGYSVQKMPWLLSAQNLQGKEKQK